MTDSSSFIKEFENAFIDEIKKRKEGRNMEIERKFLLKEIPSRLWEYKYETIEQNYISFEPEVRIRKQGDSCVLTIKSDGHLERQEVNILVSESEYNKLAKLSKGIHKTRYYIPENDYIYELDIYTNIKGLLTVEVEFKTKEDADNFAIPNWFSDEITHIKEFKNKNLSRFGFPSELMCPHCLGKGELLSKKGEDIGCECNICKGAGKVDLREIELSKYNQIIAHKVLEV